MYNRPYGKSLLGSVIVGLWVALASSAQASPELINNGGFDTAGTPPNFPPGWSGTAVNAFVNDHSNAGITIDSFPAHATSGSFSAYLGNQAAYVPPGFATAPGNLTLYQDIATTAGQTYNLTFDLANDPSFPGGANEFDTLVGLNGVDYSEFDTNLPTFGYQNVSDIFVASAPSTRILFSFHNDPGFFRLDSVSATLVPTPELDANSSALPLAFCLGSLLLLGSRRHQTRPA